MPEGSTGASGDAQIRERVNALVRAFHAKDVNAVMAHYAPEVVTFDFRPPLQVRGRDGYRQNFEAWFASVRGPLGYEIGDLHITMNGDVAFCYSLNHVKSTRTSGETAEYWVRVTSGFRKIDGQWMISHEHVSVPIHMQTMEAALELQP